LLGVDGPGTVIGGSPWLPTGGLGGLLLLQPGPITSLMSFDVGQGRGLPGLGGSAWPSIGGLGEGLPGTGGFFVDGPLGVVGLGGFLDDGLLGLGGSPWLPTGGLGGLLLLQPGPITSLMSFDVGQGRGLPGVGEFP